MVLQVEDYINILKVLDSEFDFIYYFDYSYHYNKKRPNSLNITQIDMKFGGLQLSIQNSIIIDISLYT